MTYSCSDFTDDILNKIVEAGLAKAEDVPDEDPEGQAELAKGAIDTLLERIDALTNLVRVAAAPGGIGEHEFTRPGGWREQALRLIDPKAPVLHLFFIAADDEDGNNVDLLARAPMPSDAVEHWRSYFSNNNIPEEPEWIGIVPTASAAGPIRWNDIRTLRGKADAVHAI